TGLAWSDSRYDQIELVRKIHMSMNHPLSDMITRIRNGQMARVAQVRCPASNLKATVLEVLKKEGYIRDFTREETGKGKADLVIDLKYYEGEPVIHKMRTISTPGRRHYAALEKLPKVANGLGIAIVSTSKGVMSDFEARNA